MMKIVLVLLSFAALLSSGVECFKVSAKDYENFDRMLEFGAQVFLSYLDKLREVTERLVRDNQLRTNRIAVQGYWNSFKETASKISVEERGNGVQDDVIVVVRTIRRLVLHYKDDVRNTVNLLTTEKNVQQYFPTVDMFEGVIHREKLNEIWGDMESHYFPDAPSVRNSPWDFLCYLLSTTTIETFLVNVFKTGMEKISQVRSINFEGMKESLQSTWNEIEMKAMEFTDLERSKGNDDEFLLSVTVIARVFIFYREKFLNYTRSPEFMQKVEQSDKVFEDKRYVDMADYMSSELDQLFASKLIEEVSSLHWAYFEDIYVGIMFVPVNLLGLMMKGKEWDSLWALIKIFKIGAAATAEKLIEMDVVLKLKTLKSRTSKIAYIFSEDFEGLRELTLDYWKPFHDEAYRVLNEKKSDSIGSLLPGIRASAQLVTNYSNHLINTLGGSIDDDAAERLLKNLENMKAVCIAKLLANGMVTQKELDESQRIFTEGFFELLEKLHLKDANEINDSFWALYKVTLAFLNYIYSPLSHTWNFISV
ncbi:uncharacterized protein LOC143517220 [Brachyhypopomus gauderio]|uniref:uncharacterized protein LOC143517220 n=1 Tax=Brachyhypopomus gauderio TaxID=698409 RepID=UPI004041627C